MKIIYPKYEVEKVLATFIPKEIVGGYRLTNATFTYDHNLELEFAEKEDKEEGNNGLKGMAE